MSRPRMPRSPRACRVCGCTEADCRQCVEKTGEPCHWIEQDLCSACEHAGCIITVDERHSYLTTRAAGKWTETGKIQARASSTSGVSLAARACAAKLLRIPAETVVLVERLHFKRLGYRQFVAKKPKPITQEEEDDE